MNTFATLLLAHLLADFPLQTNRIFKMKLAGNWGLALHAAIHVLLAALFLHSSFRHWLLLLILGVAHFIIDWTKLRHSGQPEAPGFLLDQLAHVLVIGLLTVAWPDLTAVLPPWLLFPALFLALIPALLTFLWVWANDLRPEQRQRYRQIDWASRHLLTISQQIGWGIASLIVAVGCIVTYL